MHIYKDPFFVSCVQIMVILWTPPGGVNYRFLAGSAMEPMVTEIDACECS